MNYNVVAILCEISHVSMKGHFDWNGKGKFLELWTCILTGNAATSLLANGSAAFI